MSLRLIGIIGGVPYFRSSAPVPVAASIALIVAAVAIFGAILYSGLTF